MTEPSRSMVVSVTHCPLCSGDHQHHVQIRLLDNPSPERAVLLFAGPAASQSEHQGHVPDGATQQTWDVAMRCPRTSRAFTWPVKVAPGPGERIAGIVEKGHEAHGAHASARLGSPLNQEYTEWVVGSADTARAYCRTMLTAAFSAIPVLYAVLKYLNFANVANATTRLAGLIPSTLFLLSATTFVGALRPKVNLVSQEEFETWREQRFMQMNKLIVWGTAAFAAGVLASLVSFQVALMWKA